MERQERVGWVRYAGTDGTEHGRTCVLVADDEYGVTVGCRGVEVRIPRERLISFTSLIASTGS